MATALDTNIFMYAHFDRFSEHTKTRAFLTTLLKQPEPFYMSWQIYYEYLRLVTHPKILTHPLSLAEATNTMKPYIQNPHCQILVESEQHHDIFVELTKKFPTAKGNFIHDCHYAALLYEYGVTSITTADSDFMKFDFLRVNNPCL